MTAYIGRPNMGIYAEYLDGGLGADPAKLATERKRQLTRISSLRGNRGVLAYAVDVTKSKSPTNINYTDLLPLTDQLSHLPGRAIDLILETPGGSGETAEDIVKLLRSKYDHVGIIVPGMAKSAGTLIAMAADEILMDAMSSLGPIDAQISWQGKQFSAQALLEGMEKIKREVSSTGSLNRAYVPILQNISPGELQNAENALDFASELVTDWLARYKFKAWDTHSSTGAPVTVEDRKQRAREIAQQLRDHSRWKTHGRSLKIDDLRQMRLQVVDYSETPDLADAIRRYYTLLQMTFATNIYKIFETPMSQIMRMEVLQVANIFGPSAPLQNAPGKAPGSIEAQVSCAKCGTSFVVQARVDSRIPAKPGVIQLPADGLVKCPGPSCTELHNLSAIRDQIQALSGRQIV
jgi:hypothetical protein